MANIITKIIGSMLGPLRFFLASTVVLAHLYVQKYNQLGGLAVNFFFVLSGYLITVVLHRIYKFNFTRFFLNRFIRLYPAYYIFAIITLLLHYTFYDQLNYPPFHQSWNGKFGYLELLGNLFIVPWAFLSDPKIMVTPEIPILYSELLRYRLIPCTWSVGVEIVCYFLLWLFVARSFLFSVLAFIISVMWHLYVVVNSYNSLLMYFPVLAALLPFSLGSICYFLLDKANQYVLVYEMIVLANKHYVKSFLAIICLFVFNYLVYSDNFVVHINRMIAVLAIILLHNAQLDRNWYSVCQFLGDLSYHIFLAHFIGGYIAWLIIGTDTKIRGISIFFLGYVITLLMGIVSVLSVDHKFIKLRDRIRPIPR